MKRDWIALFSQTGTELYNLITYFNRVPDVIITNDRPPTKRTINSKFMDRCGKQIKFLPNRPSDSDLIDIFEDYNDPVITLHGWLRIIPPIVCKQFDIYNGHPALVQDRFYPELKGLNPQERTWEHRDKYRYTGAVIHEVTEELDAGDVVMYDKFELSEVSSKDEMYRRIGDISLALWKEFLTQKLINEDSHNWTAGYGEEHTYQGSR